MHFSGGNAVCPTVSFVDRYHQWRCRVIGRQAEQEVGNPAWSCAGESFDRGVSSPEEDRTDEACPLWSPRSGGRIAIASPSLVRLKYSLGSFWRLRSARYDICHGRSLHLLPGLSSIESAPPQGKPPKHPSAEELLTASTNSFSDCRQYRRRNSHSIGFSRRWSDWKAVIRAVTRKPIA